MLLAVTRWETWGRGCEVGACVASGNQMGDVGARMLAKALQINTKLETVIWDRNHTTPFGLAAIATALERCVE